MNHPASQDLQNHPADPFAIPLRAVCIGCGCDDFYACVDDDGQPCQWLRVDYDAGWGVCSCCSELVSIWDAGLTETIEVQAMAQCRGRVEV